MSVGKDESGKYYVCQRDHRYAGPYDDPVAASREARRRGLGVDLVRLAGRTVAGGDDVLVRVANVVREVIAEASEAPADDIWGPVTDEQQAAIEGTGLYNYPVLTMNARDAIAHIRKVGYSDDDRAELVAAEREGKARVTVLRALGVEV